MKKYIITLAALMGSFQAISQDNHYEYMRMGSRNSILANAGLSRFEDQAAVILNPATLAFADNSSFAFNTTAVGFSNINFRNGLGQGFDIKYGNINVLPTMAAGVLKPKKDERDFVIGYAIYHPINDKLRFTDRRKQTVNAINDLESPGNENYLAQFNLAHEVDEVSMVLGLGWNMSDNFSIGVSQTFTYRSEEYQNGFTASAVPTSPLATLNFSSYSTDFYARYFKVMTQTKIGLAWEYDRWNFGITATLPSLGLFGSGEVMGEGTLVEAKLRANPSAPRDDYFASGRYEKRKATYKKSMSLGFGVSKPFGNVRLYGGLNAYSGIDPYEIMETGPADFLEPNTPDNQTLTGDFLTVWAGNRSVVNGSVAADWTYKKDKHILFSFHSDKHFAMLREDRPGQSLPVKRWDNYHFGLGTQQTFGSSDWVIGFRYSFAKRDDVPQPYSFDDPSEGNFLQGDRTTGTVTATSLQLMLSYAFRFGNRK